MDGDGNTLAGNPLGEFLKTRRGLLRPEGLGLPEYGRRRVPGLRREEVALLAGMSTDYYIRLEQGRERHPSQQVVEAVGRALQLDEESFAHLRRLADPGPRRRVGPRAERVSPHLLRLMNGWSDTPAFVLGHALDLLALNALARALYNGFAKLDNMARMIFLDPAGKDFEIDWDRAILCIAGQLRGAAGTYPDDPRLIEIIGELSVKSPEFRRIWARHEVRRKTAAAKNFRHPQIGVLQLHYEALTVNSAPGQELIVYHADPNTSSADALSLLGSLAASSPDPTPTQQQPSSRDQHRR